MCSRRDCCANLLGANLLPHLPSLSQLAPILAVATGPARQLTKASTVSSSVQGALVLLLAAKFACVRGWILVMASDAVPRGVRVLTLPLVLFASGLAGHAAAGGVTPAPSLLVPLFVLTVLVAAPFAGAPMRPAWSIALLAGGQGVLHAALQLLSGAAVTATTTKPGAGTGVPSSPSSSHLMTHHSDAAVSHGSGMSLMGGGHLAMVLAHLAAAVAVGLWLAAGERALWILLALTARRVVDAWGMVTALARGAGVVVACCPRLQADWDLQWAVRRSVWTAGVVPRRGPPGSASSELPAYAAVLPV
jgi:hypothetical protein